jgi:hypothetical protein
LNFHHAVKERHGLACVEFVRKFGTLNELESLSMPECTESGPTVPSSGSVARCTLLCGHRGIILAKLAEDKLVLRLLKHDPLLPKQQSGKYMTTERTSDILIAEDHREMTNS